MTDKCLITKMLEELKTARTSIKIQNANIADVLEKSNNVLLQIEASRSLKPAANDNSIPYTYNKETVNGLTQIVEQFTNSLSVSNPPTENPNFEEYLDAAEQRTDYLGCNIRKLLAISDTIQQMHMVLKQQELVESNSEDESNTEEDCF